MRLDYSSYKLTSYVGEVENYRILSLWARLVCWLLSLVVLRSGMGLKIIRTAKLTNQNTLDNLDMLDQLHHVQATILTAGPKVSPQTVRNPSGRRKQEIPKNLVQNGKARRDVSRGHRFGGRRRLARGAAQQRSGVTETGRTNAADAPVVASPADMNNRIHLLVLLSLQVIGIQSGQLRRMRFE